MIERHQAAEIGKEMLVGVPKRKSELANGHRLKNASKPELLQAKRGIE